ncbi:MAG: efflux RND transporter periplasmic adaptor subunit [Planctomycetota bacterium]
MSRSKAIYGLALGLVTFHLGCNSPAGLQETAPPKVSTIIPIQETIPIFLEENGETEAVEQAVVSARVRGILESIEFEPNDRVEEGTPLFMIEQKEFLAAVASAEANVSSVKAELSAAEAAVGVSDARIAASKAAVAVAKAELGRFESLSKQQAASQSELDKARADLETAVAAVQGNEAAKTADEASVINAQAKLEKAEADLAQVRIDLERTTIRSPISGQVTKTMVKRGNLVEDGTALVEIVQNDPIWANFNISERFLLALERETKRDENNSADVSSVKVELQRSGDKGFPFAGNLDYFDPKIDQDTGTMQLRAVFENPPGRENFLLPGLFVRVRVQIGEYEDALLIPERAVSRDQVSAFVYVVGEDNKAVRKNVRLGIKYNDAIVIESGIDAQDAVIVDGIQRVRPGIPVEPEPAAVPEATEPELSVQPEA